MAENESGLKYRTKAAHVCELQGLSTSSIDLLRNAKAAVLAAIEIYNKPGFKYRDECCAILLINAWELLLKALLSKNGKSIFYLKKRKQPYRTFSWQDALKMAEPMFPKEVDPLPVRRNLDLLSTYRDNAVHFYNAQGFGTVLFALSQTNIVNFKDLLQHVFGMDLGNEINWQLLPLGLKNPIDPIQYISGQTPGKGNQRAAVRQFLTELAVAVREIEQAGIDTGRLLTVFSVKLESTKKIQNADVVVGVKKADETPGPLAVIKTLDPNVSHPLRQKEVLESISDLHGTKFSGHVFQAVVWKHDLKTKPQYCWQAKEGVLTKYSEEIIAFLKHLTEADVEAALLDYRQYLRSKNRLKKNAIVS